MKFRFIYAAFLLLLVATATMSNKLGRAKNQGKGSTGAPGDNDVVSAMQRTCQGCHAGSATIQVTIQVEILDGAAAVTSYVPGKSYTARVTVVKAAGSPAAYGFQMVALKDAGNTDLKAFSSPGSNVQLANAGGRTYAEHKGPSTSNVFEVAWKAPASGTGSVTFYAAGDGVNLNDASGGDAAAKTTLTLPESTSATGEADKEGRGFELSENPVSGPFFIKFDEKWAAAPIEAAIFSLNGKLVFFKKDQPTGGSRSLELDASDWPGGIHLIKLTSAGQAVGTLKLVKI